MIFKQIINYPPECCESVEFGANGTAYKIGDNIDTDVIIPARFLNLTRPEDLAPHCMEDIDRHFNGKINPGDIIAAGKNFGCGSSREHAPIAIKAAGIAAVCAVSFARIFYRNAINTGLPILEFPEANTIDDGDELRIDFQKGIVHNITQRVTYQAKPYPPDIEKIIKAGGLLNSLK
ncbi:MAG: 3-isopropylmalate dehydratase small subunit [Ruminococcus sp.]|jgi:3-isopropylmalate/(R)-2-methylmalate dehydratase small subunit|nr:3-isopropylmalate dehydratase small subunit [Ruminococcus sp.]